MYFCELPVTDIFDYLPGFAGEAGAHFLVGGASAAQSWGGDWHYLVWRPAQVISVTNGICVVDGTEVEGDPFTHLSSLMTARQNPTQTDRDDASFATSWRDAFGAIEVPSFCGGAFGHVDYEMARMLEPSLNLPLRHSKAPEMWFGFYDAIAAFHRTEQRMVIMAAREDVLSEKKIELEKAQKAVSYKAQPLLAATLSPTQDALTYQAEVQKIIDYILDGDIFQANLTQQFTAQLPSRNIAASELFIQMNKKSYAPFGALLQYEDVAILSNSPERYYSVSRTQEGLKVVMEPIKGTSPRSLDMEEDRAAANELLNSEKDRAENIMIADLVRNDLSRVAKDNSVKEEEICTLYSYATVHHLVSRISGVLQEGYNAVDVLRTSFPCGSITGAPKIRAMEIIAELEQQPRGIYCGAIGYMDDRGTADFSIPIRTGIIECKNDTASVRYGAGGGITILSKPAKEFQEVLDKASDFITLFAGESGA